ncbi:MAG: hypothetical protein M1821_009497 [Bathelium mastoideum]|nr:MAG: hypothetical protein M1821_009497 [Bathelium mastoideum]KAI9688720.1 MAG: hypothetical protein M1822_001077 [Bathelium mastoideum]
MRKSPLFRQSCLQLSAFKPTLRRPPTLRSFASTTRSSSSTRHAFSFRTPFHPPPPPPRGGRTLLVAALSPAAFIAISEQDRHDGTTGEEQMLAASRAELRGTAALPERIAHSSRAVQRAWAVFDAWVWEPVATGLRFLHLLALFVPVLVSVPVVWLGRREKGRSGERAGCLWWYGFLVASMERAGAAFIKVS